MSTEQMKILDMLEAGKVTAEEATQLLKALNQPDDHNLRSGTQPAICEQPVHETLSLDGETVIDVSHTFGDVIIRGWDKEAIKLEGIKIVEAIDQPTAQMYAEQMRVEIQTNEREVTIRTHRPEPERSWRVNRRTINYELYAPHRCDIVVQTAHGHLQVTHFTSDLKINSRHGQLQVEDIGKDLSVDHEHGHVEVFQIGGDTSVKKSHGDLKLRAAKGHLKLRHNHGQVHLSTIGKDIIANKTHGDLYLTDVGGGLQIDHNHGPLQACQIKGDVAVKKTQGHVEMEEIGGRLSLSCDHSHIDVSKVSGNLQSRSSRGHVNIDQVAGSADVTHTHGHVSLRSVQEDVSVHNRHGNIEVVAHHPLTHPYTLETNNAHITFSVPKDAAIDLSARTKHGRIHTDLAIPVDEDRRTVQAVGQLNGGGIACELTNPHGNIQIETTEV